MIVRGLFIVSLIVWVAALDELLPIFLLILFSIVVLFTQGFTAVYMLKSFYLLIWLFIPTLLFHGLFTPGRLIQEPFYIPLSIEGLERGLYLSAHIGLIFFCALLVFRVFSKQEWIGFIGKFPKSEKFEVYIVLLMSLRVEVSHALQQTKTLWFNQGKQWKQWPKLMVQSVQEVLLTAKAEAKDLWENWNTRMDSSNEEVISLWSSKELMYLWLLIMGWGLFWIV